MPCAACGKIRKVLAFKGLPYRIEEYGGLRGILPRRLSSAGKLPVLDYGDLRLSDSSAIARALDARHPSPPLVPSSLDPHLVHLLEDWADESLYCTNCGCACSTTRRSMARWPRRARGGRATSARCSRWAWVAIAVG
jgi:glutathione S-transferase